MLKRTLIVIAVALGAGLLSCKESTCDKKVVSVEINVLPNGSGYELSHIDSCGGIIRTFRQEGKLDTAILAKVMTGVSKDTPIRVRY